MQASSVDVSDVALAQGGIGGDVEVSPEASKIYFDGAFVDGKAGAGVVVQDLEGLIRRDDIRQQYLRS
ncbi:hypothetical protein L484_018732 [Morus notabilis]|uniref:Uncharacterized protein n=1 Tax=Morus notabilis TaxID=981085 RepID=W9RRV0_9ROSA|nr:hypothetical protein L484_018732 [Morus notabilis]